MTNALLLIFPKDHRKWLLYGFSRLKYMFDRRFPINRETKTTSKTNDKIREYRKSLEITPFMNAVNVCKIVNVEDCGTYSRTIGEKRNNEYIK